MFAILGIAARGVLEIAQVFTARREPELLDWLAEAVGILTALGVILPIRSRAEPMSDT